MDYMLLADDEIQDDVEAARKYQNSDSLFENLINDGLLIEKRGSRNSPGNNISRTMGDDFGEENHRRFTMQIETGLL